MRSAHARLSKGAAPHPISNGADRADVEKAIEEYVLPLTGEKDVSTVTTHPIESAMAAGAFAEAPGGGGWDNVFYVGHGRSDVLLPLGPLEISGDQFASWFARGKKSPKRIRVVGCRAGGPGAPFRTAVEKAFGPSTTVEGFNRDVLFQWWGQYGDASRIGGLSVW